MARRLAAAGHDAIHVGDLGLLGALDEAVMGAAREADRVLVSADSNFGELLALGVCTGPSVVLLRRSAHAADDQVRLLLAGLDAVFEDLDRGAVVVLTPHRVRVRSLPIRPEET